MCKHTVKKLPYLLRYVPDLYKAQQMCDEAILENETLFLTAAEIKTCVTKQLIVTFMHQSLFMNAIRLKECAMKLLILIILK